MKQEGQKTVKKVFFVFVSIIVIIDTAAKYQDYLPRKSQRNNPLFSYLFVFLVANVSSVRDLNI